MTSNNDYPVLYASGVLYKTGKLVPACLWRGTDFFLQYKKFPLLLPLMSRICKLRTDVERGFSDFGENLSLPVANARKIVNLLILRLFLILQENKSI